MKTILGGALAVVFLVTACSDDATLEIRPSSFRTADAATPFDQAYQNGKAHLMAGRLGLAIVSFEKALAIDPISVAALNACGAAYDALRRPDLGVRFYARALAIEPDAPDTLNNMAISMLMAGKSDEAQRLFARAAELDPASRAIAGNRSRFALAASPQIADIPIDAEDRTRPHLERVGLAQYELGLPSARTRATHALPRAVAHPRFED
ncbi:MAG TPA: tetratricopeptide repeat protein [Acetobacteraceae bacterium]|nr:tetratricopeptide repeat protein [Acetobacteraceae bacterium]